MSNSRSLSLLIKFLFSSLGIYYITILSIYSEAPNIFYVFGSLVLLTWILSILTLKFFNKNYWWTGYWVIYLGVTAYHFQFSKDPGIVYEAMYIVFKKYATKIFSL